MAKKDLSAGPSAREIEQSEAWLGDAVLLLFVRERILRGSGRVDGEASTRMTSNHFLSAFGDPTEVEARIGRVYRAEGLNRAFKWIETHMMPTFERQEEKRNRKR
jgi:dsRNA-specific ribonuclease